MLIKQKKILIQNNTQIIQIKFRSYFDEIILSTFFRLSFMFSSKKLLLKGKKIPCILKINR